MFEFVSNLSEPIQGRYDTLIRNIKSASNSFYDSYIDLLETLGKEIAENIELDLGDKTGGYVFRNKDVQTYLINTAHIEEQTLAKINDYILKINRHKHHKEKNVSLEAVLNYMRVLFDFLSNYARSMNIEVGESYDERKIADLFGLSEKENIALKGMVNQLKEEVNKMALEKSVSEATIKKYKESLETSSAGILTLEDENEELRKQIILLKDMKLEILEAKLDQANDTLNHLKDYLVDSRAVSLAALDVLIGEEGGKRFVEKAKEDLKNGER